MSETSCPVAAPGRSRPGRGAPPSEVIFKPPAWDWVQAGEIGWWVRPPWRSILLGPGGLRLDEWRRQGRLTTVKSGLFRFVHRVELAEGAFYIKHFRVPGLRAKVRQWVRRGKGRNEGKRALKLRAIGVATIDPVALGEQRKRKFLFENYLVTHAIEGMEPLNAFVESGYARLPAARRAAVRRHLAVALAEMTARLHDAGFVHGDFHPGNLLVDVDATGAVRLALIDLDALRVRKRLRWGDVRENLALLNHYFWLRCSRSDRLRFLRAYFRARGAAPADPRGFVRAIEGSTRAWAERLWRRWGRRCRGDNAYFETYRGPTAWAVARRDLDPALVRDLLADPDAVFGRPGTRILKASRTTTVAELTMTVAGAPTTVIYKRFNRKKRLDPVLALFRPSRAWRCWQAAQALASRAVPTPRNLAVLGKRGNTGLRLLPHDTYLVTVKAEPSIALNDYLTDVLPTLPPAERTRRIRRLTIALARLLRTLHERSLSNRDLKTANILIEGDPDRDDAIRLTLIDLVGVRLVHPMSWGRRVQNLARLHVSLADIPGRTRTDALRFLREYLPWSFTPRRRWKALWRAVAARSRRKVEKNRRHGRALS